MTVNLPFVPGTGYSRGLLTGAVLVFFLWIATWSTWVASGLAFRIQGAMADDSITGQLRKSRDVYDVVASLKFGRIDVDQIIIAPAGVAAVEIKWHAQPPSTRRIGDDVHQAAAGARSLRHTLAGMTACVMPDGLVTAAVVECGPGGRAVDSQIVSTALGPVEVVNAGDLEKWLAKRGRGVVDTKSGRDLARQLHRLASDRDSAAVSAGLVLRWLARVR